MSRHLYVGSPKSNFLRQVRERPNFDVFGKMKRYLKHKSSRKPDRNFLEFLKTKHPELYEQYGFDEVLDMYVGRVPPVPESVADATSKHVGRVPSVPESIGDATDKPYKYLPSVHTDDACYKQLWKYDRPMPRAPDKRAWAESLVWMKRHFYPIMSGSEVLSSEDAWSHYVSAGAHKKSPGVVWRHKYKTKEEMYEKDKATLDKYWEELSHDGGGFCVWGGNLKDEMRPTEKVLNGSTRLFQASPFTHAHASTRLLYNQNQMMVDGRGNLASTVGMSRYGAEFDCFYKSLEAFGDECTEGDVSGWDSSFFAQALWDICEFRWECLRAKDQTLENKLRLSNLYREVIDKLVCMTDGLLVRLHSGMPSGFSNTIHDNTMHHFRLIAYWYIVMTGNSFEEFIKEVGLGLQGDDSIIVTRNPDLTMESLKEKLSWTVAIEFNSTKPKPLIESCYCSQFVKKVKGNYVAYPRFDKQLHSLAFGSKKISPDYSLLRAAGLRIHCWFLDEFRELMDEYKNWWFNRFGDQFDTDYFHTALASWKSPKDMDNLYLGFESLLNQINLEDLPWVLQAQEKERWQRARMVKV